MIDRQKPNSSYAKSSGHLDIFSPAVNKNASGTRKGGSCFVGWLGNGPLHEHCNAHFLVLVPLVRVAFLKLTLFVGGFKLFQRVAYGIVCGLKWKRWMSFQIEA
ncbi:MAG: hypothetical protein CL480_07030 [Acidobacteria bacterium]|nr:hypothetical protein [Acidobacteriota bacterium]